MFDKISVSKCFCSWKNVSSSAGTIEQRHVSCHESCHVVSWLTWWSVTIRTTFNLWLLFLPFIPVVIFIIMTILITGISCHPYTCPIHIHFRLQVNFMHWKIISDVRPFFVKWRFEDGAHHLAFLCYDFLLPLLLMLSVTGSHVVDTFLLLSVTCLFCTFCVHLIIWFISSWTKCYTIYDTSCW